jgi:hypothetical protein
MYVLHGRRSHPADKGRASPGGADKETERHRKRQKDTERENTTPKDREQETPKEKQDTGKDD